MTPDVLYRLRAGVNEPLRYSLRSLANVPHGAVHVVGYPPKWLKNVDVIRPLMWRTKWRALVGDLLLACRQLSGPLLLVDDDFFVLSPLAEMPVLHGGDLRTVAERKVGSYGRTLKWTADYLDRLGVTGQLCYDLHLPFPFEAEPMAEVLAPIEDWRRPLQARTLYGNVMHSQGSEATDVKIGDGPLPPAFLSSSPQSWAHWRPLLAERFPEPSVYE